MEGPQLFVFIWDRHTLKVTVVSYSLKVPAYQKEIDCVAVPILEIPNSFVGGIELAVAAAFDSNLSTLLV